MRNLNARLDRLEKQVTEVVPAAPTEGDVLADDYFRRCDEWVNAFAEGRDPGSVPVLPPFDTDARRDELIVEAHKEAQRAGRIAYYGEFLPGTTEGAKALLHYRYNGSRRPELDRVMALWEQWEASGYTPGSET